MGSRARAARGIVAVGAALFAVAGTAPAQAALEAPYIESIAYGGTGCAAGTVGMSIAADRRTATLIFDSFVASTGVGVGASEARKSCQATLNLRRSASCATRDLLRVDHRGYVQLPAGATGTRSATYANAAKVLASRSETFTGSVARDWIASDEFFLPQPATAGPYPVAADATIELSAIGASSTSMTTDSIDVRLTRVPRTFTQQVLCRVGLASIGDGLSL